MLTKDQIDQLFVFCEKHSVRFYDVQVELVDHLANAVEEKMAADQNLTFDNAVTQVHAGFGSMGFGGLVSARWTAMERQYRKNQWQLFCSYFTWPKALLTLCIFLLLSLPYRLPDKNQLALFTSLLVTGVFLYELYVMFEIYRTRQKNKKRKPLMIMLMPAQYAFIPFFILFVDFYVPPYHGSDKVFTSIIRYELLVSSMLLCLLGMIAYRNASKKLYVLAQKQYPEAFAIAQ